MKENIKKPEKDGTKKAEIKLIPVPNVSAIHLLNITGDFLTVGLRLTQFRSTVETSHRKLNTR